MFITKITNALCCNNWNFWGYEVIDLITQFFSHYNITVFSNHSPNKLLTRSNSHVAVHYHWLIAISTRNRKSFNKLATFISPSTIYTILMLEKGTASCIKSFD